MTTIEVRQLTADQTTAVIKSAIAIEGGPWAGVPYGSGKRVAQPSSVTVADLASGNVARWIGWTGQAVQGGILTVSDLLKATLDGTAKDPRGNTIDPATIVKDAKVLADAKAALTKATPAAVQTK